MNQLLVGQSEKMDLAAEAPASLTAREREIVLLVACGLRNKAIARELRCSEGTVKVHLHKIFQKLGIKSRWILMAHASDLVSTDSTTIAERELQHRGNVTMTRTMSAQGN